MKLVLFLGAGASVPFGKPTTMSMKKILYEASRNDILDSFLSNSRYDDVEYVLQAIRDIRELKNSVVGSYFEGVSHSFNFQQSGGMKLDNLIKRLKEAEDFVEEQVYEKYRWNNEYDEVLVTLHGKILAFIGARSDINIFTTNYDRAVEMVCEIHSEDYELLDGFQRPKIHSEYSKWTGRFNITMQGPKPVRLYKLHGSLNWKYHRKLGIVKTSEESISSDTNYIRNTVIMPTLSPKNEEVEEPFATLRNVFEQQMQSADACIVIGFSFRDSLNHMFKQFVESGKTLIVLSPTAVTEFRTRVLNEQPSAQELEAWKTTETQIIRKSNADISKEDRSIYLIQKALGPQSVEEIIRRFTNILEKLP